MAFRTSWAFRRLQFAISMSAFLVFQLLVQNSLMQGEIGYTKVH